MKKNYLIALLTLIVNFVNAQIEPTSYRGAFAPAPTQMWTDSWTNFDPKNEPYLDAATVVNVTTDITANTTWTTGKTYKLNGLIYVRNNAILTIQPGVVIKGNFNSTGTALIVTRGAKLNAIGTASSPIVFTSGKTVAEGRQPGDWGGIVLLGKAKFNINNGVNNIEGITSNVNTEYGGGLTPDDNDNSGTLKYVRIEFGGYVFSPNNEINGLTMGAVGKATTIDYVQVSYANDDAFEWFGGSVNCKHLVAFRNLDDEFDTDNGYKGVVQYALAIKDPSLADNPAVSTSEGFESDNNPAGSTVSGALDNTTAIFTNITVIGPAVRATLAPATTVASGHARALRLRRATQLKVYNSIFMDFKNNFVFIDGTAAVANANAGTLKFNNNIIAGTADATFTAGINPTSLNSWFTSNGNSFLSSSNGLLALPYDTTNTYLGLDYRPASGSAALSGANFTDVSIAPFVNIAVGSTPVVTNRTYCKGDIATPLTATLTTTGVSLKWYTLATGGTASLTAPTPATTVVGVKNYYVSQVDAAGTESSRVLLTVTTNALPTEVIGAITGVGPVGSTSVTAVGPYIGTTAVFTYSIPAFVDSSLTYLWTVPNGVNILSGQGTNSITVNFANTPGGIGNVGSIDVQAVNGNGCKTLAKKLLLTKALPLAPAVISMYNKNAGYLTPATAITTYAKYMGSTTPLTLTCSTIVGASAYQWELPTGVNLSFPAGTPAPVTTTLTYTAEPFLSPASAPTQSGNKFWVVTYNKYTVDVNGVPTEITVSTCDQKIFGTAAYGGTTSQPYLRYGTVIESNLPSILVNFSGVTNSATTALYIGVKSKTGVGTSVTSNTLNADVVAALTIPGLYYTSYSEVFTGVVPPSTNATSVFSVASTTVVKNSKLQKFTAAIPAAPTTLKLTNDALSTTLGVTVVTTYIGTTTPLTLTAAPSPTASSYSWELPAGVNQISGGNSNVITINFAGVASGITSLYLGVKAVNGIGSSVTSTNGTLVPATSSTAKLLKVTAGLPAAPTTLVLTNPAVSTTAITNAAVYLGTSTPLTLTAAVSTLATSYSWELPSGVTQLSGGNTNIITVDLAGVAPGTTTLYFGVKAVNAVGSSITLNSALVPATSSTAKLLKITNTAPAAPVTLTLTNPAVSATSLTNAGLYLGTTTPLTLTAASSALATSYSWELPTGVTQLTGGTSNVITVNLAGVAPGTATMYFGVKAVNGFGSSVTSNATAVPATSSTAKLLKITNTAPAAIIAVSGTITAISCGTTYNYTMTPTALATSYVITAPTGSVVTSASNPSNASNVLATSDLSFSIVYPSNLASVTPKTVVISSVNGFGASTLNKTLTIAPATIAALGLASTGGTTFTRCATKTISIPAVATASNYTWTVADGAVIVSGQGTNSVVVDFALVPLASTSNIITVFASNDCGVNTLTKTVSLTSAACTVAKNEEVKVETVEEVEAAYSNTSLYPNPATSEFNIDMEASKAGAVEMSIYTMNGVMVMNTKTIKLEEGRNTINENIANLSNGIYIVRVVDASNKEVMVKKLIKN